MHSLAYLAPLAAGLIGFAQAGFDPSSSSNIVVYYGQNSYGSSTDPDQQQPLAFYCNTGKIDVINLAFLTVVNGPGGAPEINLANTGNNCTTFSGTQLLHCPQVGADIKTCQANGVQVLMSIGGATYSEGGFDSSGDATTAANNLWAIFGPQQSGSSALRPFDDAVLDGFDFDFESTANNIAPFISQMRTNFATDTSKQYLLSAAPQCPYPDSADGPFLDGVSDIDYNYFYNNYCEVTNYQSGASTQNDYNFATWDQWASQTSANKNAKVLVGVPAGSTAAGAGYESASALADVLTYSKTFKSFGGVMMWDASFLDGVASDIGRASSKKARSFTA